MPDNATAQGSAKSFIQKQDLVTQDALGVSIVEGEFPGSTYYAATLKKPVDEANEIAQRLELPYRFRKRS